jgi:hypothetical protein
MNFVKIVAFTVAVVIFSGCSFSYSKPSPIHQRIDAQDKKIALLEEKLDALDTKLSNSTEPVYITGKGAYESEALGDALSKFKQMIGHDRHNYILSEEKVEKEGNRWRIKYRVFKK